MRRADRLFQIIQILRRGQLTTAQALADELEVSSRTIYRDVADLIGSGVPVEGAAGAGYLLRDGYDLPPLMFSPTELEALVLGVRIVASWADAELGRAAQDVLAKVEAVLPEPLRVRLDTMPLLAPGDHAGAAQGRPRSTAPSDPRAAQARPRLLRCRRTADAAPGLAARPVLLRAGLAARGLVRATPGLSHVPGRPHGRGRLPRGDLRADARAHARGFQPPGSEAHAVC